MVEIEYIRFTSARIGFCSSFPILFLGGTGQGCIAYLRVALTSLYSSGWPWTCDNLSAQPPVCWNYNHHDQHSCLLLSYLWYAIKTRIYSYLICKGILSLCLCTTRTYCLGRPEKGIRASETGVTYDCQLPYGLRFYRRSYTRATRTLNL